MFVSLVIKLAIYAQMSMIIIVLSVLTVSNKIELQKLRSQKDAYKHVHQEHFSVTIIVRNVMSLASNALLALIIIALNVQMDLYKMELIYLKVPKNVSRLVQQELIYAMMVFVLAVLERIDNTLI